MKTTKLMAVAACAAACIATTALADGDDDIVASATPAAKIADPVNPKPGCRFANRCPMATERCRTETPEMRQIGPDHSAACHML